MRAHRPMQYESAAQIRILFAALQTFSSLDIDQHNSSFSLSAKLKQPYATTRQSIKMNIKITFCRQVADAKCNFAS